MKLVLAAVSIKPRFSLVDDNGVVIDVTDGSVVVMYPGKFLQFEELTKQLESLANKDREGIEKLAKRPLF